MQGLASKFKGLDFYSSKSINENSYKLLPFGFERLKDKYLLVNEVGEHYYLSFNSLKDLVNGNLNKESKDYRNLLARHFIFDEDSDSAIDLLSLKVRTRHAAIRHFTGLHVFVVTLRCDYSCPYCQVSRQNEDASIFDMDEETALHSLDLVFQSPSEQIKIEFQGGEPLLNFDLIKFVVNKAKEINNVENRNLEFVIATNLSYINEDILDFCEKHEVYISTSLDGPGFIQDKNRPRPGKNSHSLVRENIDKVRLRLGPDKISALMTTTELSLNHHKEIIDEYIDAGFSDIFLRPISPYGFAIKTKHAEKYDFDQFYDFYVKSIDYILELNKRGVDFVEHYSALILKKILLPYPTGYVDLQSPAGAGISALIYNYDGDIYASDESRMLAEMGDKTFRLGNCRDSYESIFLDSPLLDILEKTLTDSSPDCYQCAFKSYCGSDPVYHYAMQKDWVGHKAFSSYCKKTKKITSYLLSKLEENQEDRLVFERWIR